MNKLYQIHFTRELMFHRGIIDLRLNVQFVMLHIVFTLVFLYNIFKIGLVLNFGDLNQLHMKRTSFRPCDGVQEYCGMDGNRR